MAVSSRPSAARRHGPGRFVLALSGLYLVLWLGTAVAPRSRVDWFLENLLVIAVVGLLGVTYRRFPLSTPSYVSIFVFLVIHALGAHYTYSEMPLGFLIQEIFGLARNHYDRFVHFAFGLLFAYPARELVWRGTTLRGLGCSFAAFVLIAALSSSYELVEWWVALIVSPDAAHAYLGTQGDVFDAQKDMTLAVAGAAIALALIAAWPRRRPQD